MIKGVHDNCWKRFFQAGERRLTRVQKAGEYLAGVHPESPDFQIDILQSPVKKASLQALLSATA